jgi:pantoate--beta-alanine ligase
VGGANVQRVGGEVEVICSIDGMRKRSAELREAGSVVGLVPTMGALHEGHLSLIRVADALADVVVVSIFVNPTQFGPSEDFERYPRDLDTDSESAESAGADILFVPSVEEMYPARFETVVHVQGMTRKMCGAFRPGHFNGVCTVVAKLLNIVRPSIAVFGQKDAQQVAVIERMVKDLDVDVEIVRGPTVREADGLAMSSRNAYLSEDERADAAVLHEALERARSLYERGKTNAVAVLEEMHLIAASRPTTDVQYIVAVDAVTLEDVTELRPGALIAMAVFVGKTRLIDNLVLGAAEERGAGGAGQ